MKKIDIAIVIGILASILAIANIYILYNMMNEMDNMYAKMLTIETLVEQNRQELIGIEEFRTLSQYNFLIIPISEIEIQAQSESQNDIARFYYDGDMAVFKVALPQNTTYRIDLYAYSGSQTSLTMGSALELIVDEETWGTITFITEEWNWVYLGTRQLHAGQHEIKIINREGGQLGDRNLLFKKIRIMWFK